MDGVELHTEPIREGSLHLALNSSRVFVTHLIDLGMMKD